MTADLRNAAPRPLVGAAVPRLVRSLESGFGTAPTNEGMLTHQQMLIALDDGHHSRFLVWPDSRPNGVIYQAGGGTVVVAGSQEAGRALADTAESLGWRVLIGDAPVAQGVLDGTPRGVLRRRVHAREQRFMVAVAAARDEPLTGLRAARARDLDRLVDFACRLHVEDRMGPPIPKSGVPAVRARMLESIARDSTWVVERDGQAIAKIDISLHSRRRGAQVAGVYVDPLWRGRGVGSAAVGGLTARLLGEGLPGVTLHVRADNEPAIAAYRRAGYRDCGAWLLALR